MAPTMKVRLLALALLAFSHVRAGGNDARRMAKESGWVAPESASEKKKKKKKSGVSERKLLCDQCMQLSRHLWYSLHTVATQKIVPDKPKWLAVVKDGCYGEEICESNLIKQYVGEIADEMMAMVEDAGGDPTDSIVTDLAAIPNLLCAPDSITRACPKGMYKPPRKEDEQRPFSVSFWNGRSKKASANGEVEIHLVDPKDKESECAPSEAGSLSKRMKNPAVNRLLPDVERLITVAVTGVHGVAPSFRVKPLGAKCGDGHVVDMDFSKPWAVYEINENKAYDVSKPSSGTNTPLVAFMMDGRNARDALPADHPALVDVDKVQAEMDASTRVLMDGMAHLGRPPQMDEMYSDRVYASEL